MPSTQHTFLFIRFVYMFYFSVHVQPKSIGLTKRETLILSLRTLKISAKTFMCTVYLLSIAQTSFNMKKPFRMKGKMFTYHKSL